MVINSMMSSAIGALPALDSPFTWLPLQQRGAVFEQAVGVERAAATSLLAQQQCQVSLSRTAAVSDTRT
jgi:hypothetical protein